MSDLDESCATAVSCMSGPCPNGHFCFPYTCVESQQQPAPAENQQPPPAENQNQPTEATPAESQSNKGLCPQDNFVGWNAMHDCREYFRCDNGSMGNVNVCGTSLKYDKTRNQCYPEQDVDSFCYGPPLEQTQAAAQGGGDIGSSSSSGTSSSSSNRDLCKEGYTGWSSRLGCQEYYWCDRGQADIIYNCGKDLIFDQSLELCNFQHEVNCREEGGIPNTADTTNLNMNPKKDNGNPNWNPSPSPKPVITFTPTTLESPSNRAGVLGETPSLLSETGGLGGTAGGYSWSYTATPTVLRNIPDIPPWLENTIMLTESGNGAIRCASW
eukprot:CAMPEP_0181106580 /NCGR_PEP_ID=MMETSP1071-20121207/16608_1 /TAXON_ID=35127 /ORGANISM="Thalassiosira sp., Strain NH16" /LENGTH=325 /DNA_ID=CAMNT_0023189997 /DNA_START=255 /DNA_END=1229 /DNA_ORIENTATION=+